MNRKPETPRREQPESDEQAKSDEQLQVNGQGKPDETPTPKPKFIFDPRYCVDLTEKEQGRGFAFVGARDPRRRKKSD